jgi:hypothetical protein
LFWALPFCLKPQAEENEMKIYRIRNGVLLICVGFVLLLNTLDKLDWSIWWRILHLWPVLLIAIGIELLFKKTSLVFLGLLSPILIILAILGPVFFSQTNAPVPSFALNEYNWSESPDSLVAKASLILDISKGKLEISKGEKELIQAKLKYSGKRPYCSFHYYASDSSATLDIRKRSGRWRNNFWGNMKDNDWNIKLSGSPLFDLRIYSAASDAFLDLSEIKLEKLRLEADVSKAKIKLGKLVPNISAQIESDVSDVNILVPKESGLKITSRADLSSTNFGLPLNKQKDTLVTDNFETAQNKIELKLDGAISSLKVETY